MLKKKKYPLFLQEKEIGIMCGELPERYESSQQQKATNGIPRRKNATSEIKNILNRINSRSNNGRKDLFNSYIQVKYLYQSKPTSYRKDKTNRVQKNCGTISNGLTYL